MNEIIHVILTASTPQPFLAVVGRCFVGAAVATAVITAYVRFGWRRRKGMEDI